MAAVLTVDGYDLQPFLRVAKDDGLDPIDADRLEPQFGEAAGGEGDPLLSLREGNAEMIWPLHVTPLKSGSFADTPDGMQAMMTDLNRRLRSAVLLEWRPDNVSVSTFHDVVHARFEPDFDYRRQQKLWCSGVLRVWAKPYGHTGTSRILATAAGSGVSVTVTPATMVAGDTFAQVTARVAGGSAPVSRGRLTGYAVVPSGRVIDIPAASITLGAGATLMGRADAAGSQVVRGASAPRALSEVGRVALPASQYHGRHRLLAVCAGTGRRLFAAVDDGQQLDGAILDSLEGIGYQTADLGAFEIDPALGATRTLTVLAEEASAPVFVTLGPHVAVNRLLLLPEGESGLAFEHHRTLYASDRGVAPGADTALTTDDMGNNYVPAFGASTRLQRDGGGPITASGAGAALATEFLYLGPSGMLDQAFASGIRDLDVDLQFDLGDSSLASAAVSAGKRLPNGALFLARAYQPGATAQVVLSIAYAFGGGSLLASVAAIAHNSNRPRLRFSNRGPQITANLIGDQTAGATVLASLGYTATDVATGGVLTFCLVCPSAQFDLPQIYAHTAHMGVGSAAPRDVILFDTEQRRITRNAASGGQVNDITNTLRGDQARLQPGATQQIVALTLPVQEQPANGILDADIRIRERFTFGR